MSFPTSSLSPSSSPLRSPPVTVPFLGERKGREDDRDGEDEQSTSSDGLATPEASLLQLENEDLRRQLAAFQARYSEDQQVERRRVIGQRVSLSAQRDVHGVTIVNESFPSSRPKVVSSPDSVPVRQGRLTLSPPAFTSPVQPPSVVSATSVLPSVQVEEDEEMTQKQREGLIKTMSAPHPFSGDVSVDKTDDVADWVEEVEKWLHIHVGPKRKGLLPFIEGLLRGGASSWLSTQRKQLALDLKARGMEGTVEWHEVREGFIEQFEGPQYRALLRGELQQLKLWKGKCKTIPLFNSEFDRLSRRLYPSGASLAAFIPVLAEDYGNCLQLSDEELWRMCVAITIPTTVDEWKLRTVSCNSTREIVRMKMKGTASGPNFKPVSTSLAHMQGEGERDDGQLETAFNAFQSTPGQGSRGGGGKGKGGKGGSAWRTDGFLTETEFSILFAQGKCLMCFQKGHRMRECPKKGKEPRRHPTEAELKA